MLENLSVLLSFRIEESNLILRLDNLGLCNFELEKQAICELVLEEYRNDETIFDNLRELIGYVFKYDIRNGEHKYILEFWGDYGRVENEIECKIIKEKFSNYTNEDIHQKGTTLAQLYSDIYERFLHNENANSNLRNKLKIEIEDEITRFQRKADFFENKNQEKAEVISSQIKVLQKLLNIIEKH